VAISEALLDCFAPLALTLFGRLQLNARIPGQKKRRQNSNSGVKYVSLIQSDSEVKGGRMLSGKLYKLFILGVVLIIGAIPYLAEAG
jgi:hypothetical protein